MSAVNDELSATEQLFAAATAELEIPPRPLILEKVAREADRDEPNLSVVADLITQDVALSAGMLKLANSPFFGLRVRARTAHQAIMMLGLELSVSTVTGMVLKNSFPPSRPMERFWDASARTAQISGWLAIQLTITARVDQGDAYTFGLFRDCGIAVLMNQYGDAYRRTLAAANEDNLAAFTRIEREHHPTTHNIVGCLLARSWMLPEASALAIRHHHDIAALQAGELKLPRETLELIAISQLAERIIQINSDLNQGCEWEKLGVYCLQTLGLPNGAEETLAAAAHSLEQDP